MSNLVVKHTAVASGNGKLHGSDLALFANNIPGDSVVDVDKKKAVDQFDTDRWTITAEWDGVSQGNWKPSGGVKRS